jgi:hypothetical protein
MALQFPATSSFPPNRSLSSQAVTQVHSAIQSSGENVGLQLCNQNFTVTFIQSRRTPAAITQSPTAPSSIVRPRRRLSNWWPIRTGHALPPIVDVPLTRGDQVCSVEFYRCLEISCMNVQRNAAAGAPKGNCGYRRDEEFDPPPTSPTQNANSQQLPAVAQTNTGEHGSGRLCFCL